MISAICGAAKNPSMGQQARAGFIVLWGAHPISELNVER